MEADLPSVIRSSVSFADFVSVCVQEVCRGGGHVCLFGNLVPDDMTRTTRENRLFVLCTTNR